MAIVVNQGRLAAADVSFCTEARTAATVTAVMALTPAFPGEIVRALDTGQRYRGLRTVAGAWGLVNVDM